MQTMCFCSVSKLQQLCRVCYPSTSPMIFLFDIGFLPVSIWDILDIIIVGYLIYLLYNLLKGTAAFNIFIGVAILFGVWALVTLLQMEMLSKIMNQIAGVAVILLIVVFQPEIRRFLLLLGNSMLRSRTSFVGRWLVKNFDLSESKPSDLQQISRAVLKMARDKTGALIVLSDGLEIEGVTTSGTEMDAKISFPLLLSIFQKESPLHDGAVVIGQGRVLAAGCILPLSESTELPRRAGLRHRAALGLSERSNAQVIIVSEETGRISFASKGKLSYDISESKLNERLFSQSK